MLLLGAEAEHILDPCAVVPAPIEDHDLSGGREPCEISLDVYLGLLAVGGRRKRLDSKHTWADAFGERFDHAALSRGVAPLEDDNNPLSSGLHPVLQVAQLLLQAAQFLLVRLGL